MGVKEFSKEYCFDEDKLEDVLNDLCYDCGDHSWYIMHLMEELYDKCMMEVYANLSNPVKQYRLMDNLFDQDTIKDYVWENHNDWIKEVGRDEGDYY